MKHFLNLASDLLTVWMYLLLGVAAAGVLILVFLSASARGEREYCYISKDDHGLFVLYTSINWRIDEDLGRFETLENAERQAERLGCSVR